MFTTAELFYYFHLPAICLYLVAWWIYRRNRAQKSPDLLAAQRKNPSPGFAPWPPRPRTVHNPGAGQVCLWSCARPSSCAFPRVQAHPRSRRTGPLASCAKDSVKPPTSHLATRYAVLPARARRPPKFPFWFIPSATEGNPTLTVITLIPDTSRRHQGAARAGEADGILAGSAGRKRILFHGTIRGWRCD